MEYIKVENYINQNEKLLFPNKKYTRTELTEALVMAPDELESVVFSMPLRKPLITAILAWLGCFDHFYLGNIVKGFIKAMTLNGFLIWWIIDIFTATNRCRTYNCKNLMSALSDPAIAERLNKQDEIVQNAVNTGKKYAPVAKEVIKGAKEIRDGFFIN